MILARNSITLHHLRDITAVVWYYKLQSSTASAPAKPTTATPSGWTTTEPSYTEGSTNSLYVCQKTTFSDGSFEYSDVSLSSSYEAAKAAYNKSVQAKDAADAAQADIDNLEVGGRNLYIVRDAQDGYINASTGGIAAMSSGNNEQISDFIPVQEGDSIIFQAWALTTGTGTSAGSAWLGYMFYDSEKKKIGTRPAKYDGTVLPNGYTYNYYEITAPANAAYIRCSYRRVNGGYAKVEKGNRATDWTPAPEDLQADIDALQPELIVGTHGTTATATWTGTSTVLTEIKAGTRIQYKLSSAGASNVTLNLTLKNGTTTGAKKVYFLNTTRLGTQYGVNAVVDLVYDGSAWRVLNPYTNSDTVGAYAGAVKAGANGVYNYSLVMRDTADTWVSLTTSAGTGTSKARYTGGLYPDKVLYMGSNAAYAEGATTGTCYDALALNLNYSTNSGSSLTVGKAVYLVGEIHSDGLFYLDSTWWTQTVPTTENGKTYIYLGLAYNTSSIYLASENTLFVYYDGKFRTLREAEELKAAKTATNYLSADTTGIMIANMTDGDQYTPSNPHLTGSNVFITAGYGSGDTAVPSGVNIRDGRVVRAHFGETVIIGQEEEARVNIEPDSLVLLNPANYAIVRFTTENSHDGYAYASLLANGDGISTEFNALYNVAYIRNCYYQDNNESLAFPEIVPVNSTKLVFDSPPSRTFVVEYATLDTLYMATLGTRYSGDTPEHGAYGSRSVAIGNANNAYGAESIAIGSRNNINTNFGLALGQKLNVDVQVARNRGNAQTVIGRFNEQKSGNDYSFIIGNGTSDNDRKNALAIRVDNEFEICLDTSASSGTPDAVLYDAIMALGWEDDVLI